MLTCIVVITDVITTIEADDSNTLAASVFNVQTFIRSNKLPAVVAINSACELSDVFTDVDLSKFGPKGNLRT